MAYFPFYMDIKGKRGVIVGGGRIAAHKVEKLVPFGAELTVVAPWICEVLRGNPAVRCVEREFRDEDVENAMFVIAATDDDEVNAHVSEVCRARNILVNVVDDQAKCGFLFPSIVKEGALTVGISTEGASPQAAAWVRSEVAAALPSNLDEILEYLGSIRMLAKKRIANAERRKCFLKETALFCLELGRGLTSEETEERIKQYASGESAGTIAGVTLIGAGCGAYDLITVRGLRLLRSAQVLVYDDLIDERLLAHVSESCERLYVGKRDGRHSRNQEEINALLIEKAQNGRRVVRLKGGDSFVFGRGGEEIAALQQAGIPVTVVPGISSCIAIPELAGIPVTHRGVAQSFHVMPGHTASTPDTLPPEQELRALAQMNGTCIFLMGLHRLDALAHALMTYGKSTDTPAAVIHGDADAPAPVCVRATLSTIVDATHAAGIKTPAVIVVGDAAGLTLI